MNRISRSALIAGLGLLGACTTQNIERVHIHPEAPREVIVIAPPPVVIVEPPPAPRPPRRVVIRRDPPVIVLPAPRREHPSGGWIPILS